MAGASGNTEELRERVNEAKQILKLRDVDEEKRMDSFRICAENDRSRDTRCLVVLKGFNGKQGKQYFWERQRAGNTLTEENEECDYEKGRHAETYILARLDLYLEKERGAESLGNIFGNMNISNDQRQKADVQKENDGKKIVTIYINYSPCEKTTDKIKFPSCMKRIIEFLTAHDDIIMNIKYVNKYESGKSGEASDIDGKPLEVQLNELTTSKNRLNIKSDKDLAQMIDEMKMIITKER